MTDTHLKATNTHSGKTAIVTGASTGIGRATAEALARAGFTVFGTSRSVRNDGPAGVTMLTCDVTDDAAVHALVAAVVGQTGRIDILVNNAGLGQVGAAEESSIGQVQGLFDVNLFGVIRVTNAVLPVMRQRGEGRIINLSSVLGLIPAPFSAYYSATKHALEGYSESLDHELRVFNIRVSLIEPAFTRSVFDQNALEPDLPLIRLVPVPAHCSATSCPSPTRPKSSPRRWCRRQLPHVRAAATPPASLRDRSACCAGSPRRGCSTRACASSCG
jgi:NAD(P)-dependent dehydrogenase (short-subunit alcohol dehydrogenase family)